MIFQRWCGSHIVVNSANYEVSILFCYIRKRLSYQSLKRGCRIAQFLRQSLLLEHCWFTRRVSFSRSCFLSGIFCRPVVLWSSLISITRDLSLASLGTGPTVSAVPNDLSLLAGERPVRWEGTFLPKLCPVLYVFLAC